MTRESNMLRTTFLALAGTLAGIVVVVLVLCLTNVVLRFMTPPKLFEMEHRTIYLTVVLGAGFGAVCGGLIGAAGAFVRALRERPPTSGA
jgi:hypothetical protein